MIFAADDQYPSASLLRCLANRTSSAHSCPPPTIVHAKIQKNILNRQSACQHVTNNPNFTPFHPWRKESHCPAQSSYPIPTLSGHPTPSHRHSNRISTLDWDGVRGARLPLPYLPRLTRRRTETTSQGAWSSFRVLWSLHLASTSE